MASFPRDAARWIGARPRAGACRGARGPTAATLALLLALVAAPATARGPHAPAEAPPGPVAAAPATLEPAQANAAGSQSLESHSGYNSDYLFGMTRGVADSTLTPALKPVLFIFTLPLDVAFLPFALIGGFF